jgi:glutathione S-transferase
VGERVFRPAERRHAPYVERCTAQLRSALDALESECAMRGAVEWFDGARMRLPDITLACVTRYIAEAPPLELSPWAALKARVDRYEGLPLFRRYYARFEAPVA